MVAGGCSLLLLVLHQHVTSWFYQPAKRVVYFVGRCAVYCLAPRWKVRLLSAWTYWLAAAMSSAGVQGDWSLKHTCSEQSALRTA
jgi:hypothetical protein